MRLIATVDIVSPVATTRRRSAAARLSPVHQTHRLLRLSLNSPTIVCLEAEDRAQMTVVVPAVKAMPARLAMLLTIASSTPSTVVWVTPTVNRR
jgi:hypothetical protein